MKKILFLFMMLLSFESFSQNTLYVVSTQGNYEESYDDCGNDQFASYSYESVELSHEIGTYLINATNILVEVSYYEAEGDCDYGSGSSCGDDFSEVLDPFDSLLIHDDCYLNLHYYSVLLPTLEPLTDNSRCSDEILYSQYQDGIDHEVLYLTWQYLNTSNEWTDVSNFTNRYPLNVTVQDLLGANFSSLYSGNLQLRFKIETDFYNYSIPIEILYSPIVTFQIKDKSPSLINVQPIDVSCNGANDGSFTFEVDRDIEANEQDMFITLFQQSIYDSSSFITIGNYSPTSLTLNANGNYEFTYPNNDLISGNYYVKYFTRNMDGTVDCLIETALFPISEPPPLIISGTVTADVLCYGDNTGSINLSVYGANGGYSYSTDGGTNWTVFGATGLGTSGSPITQNLTGLGAGNYVIQIKDSNDCIAKDASDNEIILNLSITEPTATLSHQVPSIIAPSCNGEADATISVLIQGGTSASGVYQYTIDGGASQNTNTSGVLNASGLAAGTHAIVVTDANACQITINSIIPITPLLAITALEITNPVSCNGATDGELTVNATGGTGAYSYAWYNINDTNTIIGTSATLSDIGAGTYYVTLTDVNNCTKDSDDITIGEPAMLMATYSQSNILCKGDSTGEITLSVYGGNGEYSYSINGGSWIGFTDTALGTVGSQITQTINSLPAGAYTVELKDVKSCTTADLNITLTEPSTALQATLTDFTNPTSPNTSTGTITISVSGGVPELVSSEYIYTYTINGVVDASYATTGTIALTSLDNIPYTIIVTDSNGCTATINQELIDPEPLVASIIVNNALACYNDTDASITVSAQGGTTNTDGTYNYTWYKLPDTTTVIATTATLSGIGAGDYKVEVRDRYSNINNILAIATQFIENPIELLITSSTLSHNSCYGETSGAVDITVTGGTGTLSYDWQDSTNTTIGTSTSQDINNLAMGSYSLTITDANGCTVSQSFTVEGVATPLEITWLSQTNPTSATATDASINVSVTGGTPTYTYEWINTDTNLVVGTSEDLSGVGGGSYQLTVTDINAGTATASAGCITISDTYVLVAPDPLTVSITETRTLLCNGDNYGELTATANGGVAPYSYEWFLVNVDSSLTSITQTSAIATNLEAGNYTVTVTDSNGINATPNIYFSLNEPDAISISVTSITPVVCFGENGTVTVAGDGGDHNYTYTWYPAGTNTTVAGIAATLTAEAGFYDVVVSDGNGCLANLNNLEITGPTAALTFDTEISQNLTGFETNDGSITATATGGYPPYTYAWTGPAGYTSNASPTISSLAVGDYNLSITDAQGCVISNSYTLTQLDALSITAVNETLHNICFGDANASLQAVVIGGTGSYHYTWTYLDDTTTTFPDTAEINGLLSGNYTLTVTDTNGNTTTYANAISITENTEIQITATVTNVLCNGAATGSIDVTVTGGTGTYNSFSWTNGATTEDISGLFVGTYTLTVIDSANCPKSATFTITEPAYTIQLDSSAITPTSGSGLNDGTVAITVSGGTGTLSYAWYLVGDTTILSTTDLLTAGAGDYFVIITDTNGCTLSPNPTFTILEPDAILIENVNNVLLDCFNDTVTITPVVSGGVLNAGDSYIFAWYDSADILLPNATTLTLSSGVYYLTITDSNGNTKRKDFEISQPLALEAITAVTDNVCYGANDGVITVTMSGGTSPYSYSWDSGQDTATITGLTAGSYELTVIDDKGCEKIYNIPVGGPTDNFTATATVTMPSAGLSDGAINVSITGGETPYSYQWYEVIAGTDTIIAGETAANISGLSAGEYKLIVTDALGCIISPTFNLNDLLPLTIAINETQSITCNGDASASLEAISTGGAGNNNYTWYATTTGLAITTPTNSTVISNLVAGFYYVVVTDLNNNSQQSATFEVIQPNAILVTSSAQNLTCLASNDGQIQLSATGGSGTYEYRIKQDSGVYSAWISFGTELNLTSLVPDTYDIQVQDTNGCLYELSGSIATISFTITEPIDPIHFDTETTTDPLANTSLDGNITVTVLGGTSPYTYVWATASGTVLGSTTNVLDGIGAGTYTLVVTDNAGCEINNEYTLEAPSVLTVNVVQQQFLSCNGDTNASILATALGGMPATTGAAYTYEWFLDGSSSVVATTALLIGVGAGDYFVIATDANGITVPSDIITVAEPLALAVSFNATYTGCGGTGDWELVANVSGGTTPYSYAWNTSDFTDTITNVSPGTYLLNLVDANGCSLTETYTIDAIDQLTITASTTALNCFDTCDGTINLTLTGGNAPYTVAWNDGSTAINRTGLCAGTYQVTVTDDYGCEKVATYTLDNPDEITLDLGAAVTLCADQELEIDISIADTGATYLWSSSNGFTSTDALVALTEAGDYTATITSSLGCVATDIITINTSSAGVSANFLITSEAFAGEDIILVNTSMPISPDVLWQIPSAAIIVEQTTETITLRFDTPGAYEITLVSTSGACQAHYTKPIIVHEARDLPDVGDANSPFITNFTIMPNPNDGNFVAVVDLAEEANISLRLFSLISEIPVDDRTPYGQQNYSENYSLSLTTGTYFLLLETPRGRQIRKVIIE